LNGGLNSIIANDNGNGQAIVKIAPTEVAFVSQDCGTWQRIGDAAWCSSEPGRSGRLPVW
jgi:hypothetical protein